MSRMGKANPLYGQRASYGAVHQYLATVPRGTCDCGGEAQEWALKKEADAMTDEATGFLFSRNLEDYVAMCKRCHRRYDENIQKAWDRDHEGRAGKQARGERHWTKRLSAAAHPRRNAKLNLQAVRVVRWALKNGYSGKLLSRVFSVSEATVSMIKTGERWEASS